MSKADPLFVAMLFALKLAEQKLAIMNDSTKSGEVADVLAAVRDVIQAAEGAA